MITSVANGVPLQSFKMPFINPSFQRWSKKNKWFWRVVMILLTVVNAWEWSHDVSLGRTAAAIIDAAFVLLALGVIAASFLGRGKGVTQDR